MHPTCRRPRAPTMTGLTAIGRKTTGAMRGSRDTGTGGYSAAIRHLHRALTTASMTVITGRIITTTTDRIITGTSTGRTAIRIANSTGTRARIATVQTAQATGRGITDRR